MELSEDPVGSRRPREDSVRLAHRRLRADVLSGSLRPGATVSQVRLAAELGISRGPLREALRQLAAEGLVTGDFNQRMRVSELDLDDFDQLYAMRIALEPVGVAATISALDGPGRSVLCRHVDAMDDSVDDLDAFREHHRAFHLGLTAGAGARIRGVLADLWDHSERYRISYLHSDDARAAAATSSRLRVSQEDHRRILDAALAGDARSCSDALLAHLHRTLQVVFAEAARAPRARIVKGVAAVRDPDRALV